MENKSFQLGYWLVVPSIIIATGILGYHTFRSLREQTELREQTIAQSLLSVAQQGVGSVERYVRASDNTVFGLVDPDDPATIDTVWLPEAASETPSVSAVLLLDREGNIIRWASTDPRKSRRRPFLKVFRQDLVGSLDLTASDAQPPRHLHTRVGRESYLLSYKPHVTLTGEVTYIVAFHETEYLIEQVFPVIFSAEQPTPRYNVVDENNQVVFGPDLSQVGVYTVGHRFPKTLYEWRLQVAPRQAELLQAQGQSRVSGAAALPLMSFAVILLSAVFFLYAAEKERRLSKLKSELMANVSHELKTPLSVVRMFSDMLRSGRVPSEERRHEYLDIICRESERLTSLIDNVLDFSALESGRGTYRLRRADLGEAIRRALDAFRYRSEQEGVEIQVETPEELPPVLIDQEAIALAVINLLDNALKYGGQTPVELELSARRSVVDIAVRDHGSGIPPESLRWVFDRFYRGRHGEPTRGSGIGLSLVKHIAQAHGGRAWARNAAGGGAVVGFWIPVATGRSAQ